MLNRELRRITTLILTKTFELSSKERTPHSISGQDEGSNKPKIKGAEFFGKLLGISFPRHYQIFLKIQLTFSL